MRAAHSYRAVKRNYFKTPEGRKERKAPALGRRIAEIGIRKAYAPMTEKLRWSSFRQPRTDRPQS